MGPAAHVGRRKRNALWLVGLALGVVTLLNLASKHYAVMTHDDAPRKRHTPRRVARRRNRGAGSRNRHNAEVSPEPWVQSSLQRPRAELVPKAKRVWKQGEPINRLLRRAAAGDPKLVPCVPEGHVATPPPPPPPSQIQHVLSASRGSNTHTPPVAHRWFASCVTATACAPGRQKRSPLPSRRWLRQQLRQQPRGTRAATCCRRPT